MSRHFVKATVRVAGVKKAAFIVGDWGSYEDTVAHMRTEQMDRILDVLMTTVAAMQCVPVDTVSVDRDIVYADSAERVL
ncbi:hypothetical protein [Xanthomonas phage SB1]|uniref:Uncharacterized protein n=1 Tax=Xanthomonas phage SB1 TaxID=3117471 RepID=A0ABZ2GY05_9CAUD